MKSFYTSLIFFVLLTLETTKDLLSPPDLLFLVLSPVWTELDQSHCWSLAGFGQDWLWDEQHTERSDSLRKTMKKRNFTICCNSVNHLLSRTQTVQTYCEQMLFCLSVFSFSSALQSAPTPTEMYFCYTLTYIQH